MKPGEGRKVGPEAGFGPRSTQEKKQSEANIDMQIVIGNEIEGSNMLNHVNSYTVAEDEFESPLEGISKLERQDKDDGNETNKMEVETSQMRPAQMQKLEERKQGKFKRYRKFQDENRKPLHEIHLDLNAMGINGERKGESREDNDMLLLEFGTQQKRGPGNWMDEQVENEVEVAFLQKLPQSQ